MRLFPSLSILGNTLILAGASPAGERKPNIIFIMCDDMGYGDLGCYGQPFIHTQLLLPRHPALG